MLDKIFPKIHNEGYKFIVIFIFATIILYFISGFLGFIGLVLQSGVTISSGTLKEFQLTTKATLLALQMD